MGTIIEQCEQLTGRYHGRTVDIWCDDHKLYIFIAPGVCTLKSVYFSTPDHALMILNRWQNNLTQGVFDANYF